MNRDLTSTWEYHDSTKHSFWSIRHGIHTLDWSNKPLEFKVYTELDPIELPREVPPLSLPALEAIQASGTEPPVEVIPGLRELVQILYYTGGITRSRPVAGGELHFRAASCTGALYEIDLYVVCADLEDLPAGVYHFSPADLSLRRLREGDYREVVAIASGSEPAVSAAPVIVISTGTYWRNSWKYRSRTYRHFGWDNGTMLANLFATAAALELPARLVLGFVDEPVNKLLALETEREVALSLVALGRTLAPLPVSPVVDARSFQCLPLSARELDYPAMRAMHAASTLVTEDAAQEWRKAMLTPRASRGGISSMPLAPLREGEISVDALGDVILRRGSTRRFSRSGKVGFGEFSTLLTASTRGIAADFLAPFGALMNSAYLIVSAVEELQPGAYFYDRERSAVELLKEGDFRAQAGYLGLEQDLPADASFTVFLLADLSAVLELFGNRGYRAAQLEAGILGGKMYLAAYGQRFGASGLTFYDDDVVEFFSPHAAGLSPIFHLAFGRGAVVSDRWSVVSMW